MHKHVVMWDTVGFKFIAALRSNNFYIALFRLSAQLAAMMRPNRIGNDHEELFLGKILHHFKSNFTNICFLL